MREGTSGEREVGIVAGKRLTEWISVGPQISSVGDSLAKEKASVSRSLEVGAPFHELSKLTQTVVVAYKKT